VQLSPIQNKSQAAALPQLVVSSMPTDEHVSGIHVQSTDMEFFIDRAFPKFLFFCAHLLKHARSHKMHSNIDKHG
jgi:hypothetical protein